MAATGGLDTLTAERPNRFGAVWLSLGGSLVADSPNSRSTAAFGRKVARSLRDSIWLLAALFSIVLLILKVVLAFSEPDAWKHGEISLPVIGIVLSFYCLFLLEGLLAAGSQLRNADQQATQELVRRDTRFSTHEPHYMRMLNLFKRSYERFVIGRQILAVLLIVFISQLFFLIPISDSSPAINWLDNLQPGFGKSVVTLYDTRAVEFFAVALIPCWWAQLLPQLLAEHRPLRFTLLPGTAQIVWASRMAAIFGAGVPAVILAGALNGKRSAGDGKMPTGDEELFNGLVRYFGYFIDKREVKIQVSQNSIRVAEKTLYRFVSGEHSEIFQTIEIDKSYSPAIKQEDWIVTPPEKMSATPAKIHVYDKPVNRVNSDGIGTVETKTDRVYTIQSSFTAKLPRVNRKLETEEVRVDAAYDRAGPLLEPENKSCFKFKIEYPTREVKISVECSEDVMLVEEIEFRLKDLNVDRKLRPQTQSDGRGCEIVILYPPKGMEIESLLDFRVRPASANGAAEKGLVSSLEPLELAKVPEKIL